jgi:hypothetical protein
MISAEELNPHGYETTDEIQANLADLLIKINKIRLAYGKPMTVTSGLRSTADQTRINPSAPKSKHLSGQAIDIYDPSGEIKVWIKDNEKFIEEIGFWFEDFSSTPTWVHFQTVAPKSGKRFFIP